MSNELNFYIRAIDQAGGTIDKVGGHIDSLGGKIKNVLSYAGIGSGIAAVVLGVKKLVGALESGFDAMEDMRMSTASIASLITTFADSTDDIAVTYRRASDYAEQLVRKLEDIDSKTIATGKNLNVIVQALIQGGVLLDINNQKQIDGFIALTNALKILLQGQEGERQIRQEIRALVEGQVDDNSVLARILEQKVGGNLKEHLRKWKEQGTVIEEVGKLLEGFSQGTDDIANTWTAVKSTLDTISNRVLRDVMAPTYEDIVKTVKELTDEFTKQEGSLKSISEISQAIHSFWVLTKDTITVIAGLPKLFPDMIDLFSRMTDLQKAFLYSLFAAEQALTGRGKKAAEFWGKAVESLKEMISLKKEEGKTESAEEKLDKARAIIEKGQKEKSEKLRLLQSALAEERKKQAESALKNEEASIEHQAAIGEKRLAMLKAVVEEEKATQELRYEDGRISAQAYYDLQIRMARNLAIAEINELQKSKSAIVSVYELKKKAAAPEELNALEMQRLAGIEKINKDIIEKEGGLNVEIIRLRREREEKIKEIEKERLDTEGRLIEEILREEHIAAAEKRRLAAQYTEIRKEQIKQEGADYLKTGADRAIVGRWVSGQLKDVERDLTAYTYEQLNRMLDEESLTAARRTEIRREMRERIQQGEASAWEAFKFGWREVFDDSEDAQRKMVESGRRAAAALKDAFADFFFDAMKGEMKSFKDYWQHFWNTMARIRAEELSRQVYKGLFGEGTGIGKILSGAMGKIGSWLGSGNVTAGSIVSSMTSFQANPLGMAAWSGSLAGFQHGGITNGPAIAGEGRLREGIVPLPDGRHIPALIRDQGGGGQQIIIVNNISAVDAPSFEALCSRYPGAILGPVAESFDLGGIMRVKTREAW